jgi:subtilisin family serine protease
MRVFPLLLTGALLSFNAFAQKQAPDNWFNLDPKQDKIWGVSTERAYKELPIGKNSEKIIVAVIDAGTDINHEDLKGNLWVNTKEIPGNGIDDDKNGYIDDINGWSFIGGAKGNVKEDTYEYTRILGSYLAKGVKEGETPNFKTPEEKALYEAALKLYEENYKSTKGQYDQFTELMDKIEATIKKTGSKNPTMAMLGLLPETTKEEKSLKQIVSYIIMTGGPEESPVMVSFREAQEQLATMVNYNLNKSFDPRYMVGDNYDDLKERYYGNNQVSAPNTDHGTHVAGIIAADRNNDIGIKGISDRALIMTLRVVPNGDERDKDIANAIRYAADNGAKVINMSFGKKLSPNKDIIDEAVAYAMSKDVLLIHAAGNDGKDITKEDFYPTATNAKTGLKAANWIEVGACSWEGKKKRVADFSNYGLTGVEVFAPGVDLNSCYPDSKYKSNSGTSMAAPVVSGIAAVIRQNYPKLTAVQTKQIILMSAIPCKEKVMLPGSKKKTKMKKISVTGAIVNVYEALLLAEKVSKGEVTLPQ